jgi:hypothetical protein
VSSRLNKFLHADLIGQRSGDFGRVLVLLLSFILEPEVKPHGSVFRLALKPERAS